jgi:hypothetical protein
MRYPLVYGGLAGIIAIVLIILSMTLDLPSHAHSMWFGYLLMIAALSLIFVGVKRYRDVECGGIVRFGRAFGIGVAIAAVSALVYAAGFELFLAVTGSNFMDQYMADYSATTIAGMRADGASQTAIAATMRELDGMAQMMRNPLYRVPMVFIEIFPVGLLVALVSALILRNPRVLAQAR